MLVTNDVLPTEILRHGAYLCVQPSDEHLLTLLARLEFTNEFDATSGHPADAYALLRRVDATPRDLADDALMQADAIVHVASPDASRVAQFCEDARYALR
ncbi:MAG TPA: hypothetical protein VMU84_12540, partial [Thermoanaerobaculia bacterium]|nr:hypothetical protein [Thermoanaerobaculia bacterium]